jgi:hypothetical protein
MKCWTISWRRSSKRSSSVAGPSDPSNTYSLSICTIGRLRRSMLSASRRRVSSFSLARRSLRAASHSSRLTICGRLIVLSF